jgi:hypothetical protein
MLIVVLCPSHQLAGAINVNGKERINLNVNLKNSSLR